ncbi:SulP family sulfate permease [Natronocella acetinitrilica]|uniref:SulP family sulfate permease n=1 Tax=Natronocella acetinitrilica TaxID=414046 RepID=A0AAE3G3H3_9GAMM|nr:sulfate permease [Natronocella acetinitrilica]MCP1675115.1 SulP family sulfate permease [Natronocella acetinitrilica]
MKSVRALIPDWISECRGTSLRDDLLAGTITAVLLVPQGMALALLAGLPPILGLYAGILPPILYALFGSSRTMAVGPASVAALLVATALGGLGHAPGSAEAIQGAITLAALSAVILLAMGFLRLGALANYLSHPVLAGFVSGAALVIIFSQLPQLTGVALPRDAALPEQLMALINGLAGLQPPLLLMGGCGMILLFLARTPLVLLLQKMGLQAGPAKLLSRCAPLMIVLLATGLTALLGLERLGIPVVGDIPAGLPQPSLDFLHLTDWRALLPAALVISIIGYVESVSVAKALAWRRRQRIDPNRELLALGAANAGAAFSGTMPVAGGFARSVVNFDAGARTQFAGIVTALLVALTALFLTPLFQSLPLPILAALIVVAVIPLIDLHTFRAAWHYDKADGLAMLITFLGVVLVDIEMGLLAGLCLSVIALLWRTSHPHVAVVGRVPGTDYYRNVSRHEVETWPNLLLLRIDESLYFANTAYVEQLVGNALAQRPEVRHVVLICTAMNHVDLSAVETLQGMALNLREAGVTLHLAGVKGPIMDRLRTSGLMEALGEGHIYFNTEQAVLDLVSQNRSPAHF